MGSERIKTEMKTIEELQGKTFLTCTACMSVWADGLSWANANKDKLSRIVEFKVSPCPADNIVVLACQVTDLAILNDLRVAERYKKAFPNKNVFISGCLAQRMDIDLPAGIERLETPRCTGQHLNDRSLVHWEKPFWVPDYVERDEPTNQGHLFRDMYPLRIGKGCPNKCTYCTIRITRGTPECYEGNAQVEEFKKFDNVVLVADNPLPKQVLQWCDIAETFNKPVSFRNMEPGTLNVCYSELRRLADKGLLKVLHSPVQSCSVEVLEDMGRNATATLAAMKHAAEFKAMGVFIATNIIIDYKHFKQQLDPIYSLYDYVSWNPYWDGKWNRAMAETRFAHYFPWSKDND